MNDFSKLKILVIGDVMLDRYWYGDCTRISPEAPVPVVNVSGIDDRLGGAANAALNLSTIGCEVSLYGLIGDDEAGRSIETLLSGASVRNFCGALLDNTILKLRVLTNSQQAIRLDFEKSIDDRIALDFASSEFLAELIADNDLILLSDYLKGSLKYADKIINLCKSLGKKVIVDPKSTDPFLYCDSTILTPNKREFESFFGFPISESGYQFHAHSLIEQLNLQAIVITLSENGILCVTPSETRLLPTVAREVVDVTGAGDVFVAWLSAMFAHGSDLFESCSVANTAAGLSVERVGTVGIGPADIDSYSTDIDFSRKCFSIPERLLDHISSSFPSNKPPKLVFTNGCFDVIHAGHISYLSAAKKLGDILIVGINDDASVSRLKGPDRPVNNLDDRSKVLASMYFIDFVVPFSHDTPLELIKLISPDVLVKGGDYAVQDIVGYDFVVAKGGLVTTLPLIHGLSTTSTLERLS